MKSFLHTEIESSTSLRFSNWSLSYISNVEDDKDYYHQCYKLIISLNKTFTCVIDGEILTNLKGLIINTSIPHSFVAGDTSFLITLIKTSSVYGEQLENMLNNQACKNINSLLSISQFNPFFPHNYMDLTNNELILPVYNILNYIVKDQFSKSTFLHKQTVNAVHFIEKNIHDRIWLKDVAMHINLSVDRTRHLFAQQMSMPFSQYVLWRKIKQTLFVVISEKVKLSEACLQLGFIDQSHFNHSFKNILGLKPKEIVNCKRVLL